MPESQVKDASADTFDVGAKVIVCDLYVGTWNPGFIVAAVVGEGYILERLSDGYILPDVFPCDTVRLERRQDPLRGIRGSYLDRRQAL